MIIRVNLFRPHHLCPVFFVIHVPFLVFQLWLLTKDEMEAVFRFMPAQTRAKIMLPRVL